MRVAIFSKYQTNSCDKPETRESYGPRVHRVVSIQSAQIKQVVRQSCLCLRPIAAVTRFLKNTVSRLLGLDALVSPEARWSDRPVLGSVASRSHQCCRSPKAVSADAAACGPRFGVGCRRFPVFHQLRGVERGCGLPRDGPGLACRRSRLCLVDGTAAVRGCGAGSAVVTVSAGMICSSRVTRGPPWAGVALSAARCAVECGASAGQRIARANAMMRTTAFQLQMKMDASFHEICVVSEGDLNGILPYKLRNKQHVWILAIAVARAITRQARFTAGPKRSQSRSLAAQATRRPGAGSIGACRSTRRCSDMEPRSACIPQQFGSAALAQGDSSAQLRLEFCFARSQQGLR